MAHIRGGYIDPSTSREAQPSVSAPQDSSQASQALSVPSFEALADSQRLSALLPKSSSRGLWLHHRPFRAIQIVELGHFIMSSTSTWRLYDNSRTFGICLDCSRGRPESTAIRFNIDGCQGILEAKHIAEALHILFQLEDPAQFR
ncbi:hypothetical protein CK203_105708 [Vitis vinifera]|uniref:Uncharacterized protein n=1 Tax=Vitis vinifera TaxID=29760 RepID=A0A438BPH5_VITVI|nr:hypothetical protein CK203_105708 [Vitis vinifera]